MCQFASSVITRTSVLWLKDSESHTDIIEHYKLPDDKPVPDFVKVEIVPTGDNWLNMDKWIFRIDQDVLPPWYNPVQDEHRARLALKKRFPRWKGNLTVRGHLDLSDLTSLPAGVRLRASGCIWLDNVTKLSPAVDLRAAGNISLSGLTRLPANVNLRAGGSLQLPSLLKVPGDAKLHAWGYIYLDSLAKLPANLSPSAGGLYLPGLSTLHPRAKLYVGGDLYVPSLTGDIPGGVVVMGQTVRQAP